MDEQKAATEVNASKCPHREAVGMRWGDIVTDERKIELDAMAERQSVWWAHPSESRGNSPCKGVELTGADVFWLAFRAVAASDATPEALRVASLRIHKVAEDTWERFFVSALHLEGACLRGSHLEGATLAHAHLEETDLSGAHLESADLSATHLEQTFMAGAHLERASIAAAHLERAHLVLAHLEEANLSSAQLDGADLSECWFDNKTLLDGIKIDRMTKLGDVHWGGIGEINLARIPWERVPTLGDEHGVTLRSPMSNGYIPTFIYSSMKGHNGAVRAYHQVAAQLRAQGIHDVADRFSYRAQIRQRWAYLSTLLHDWRRPWRWPGDLTRYLGSLFLAVLAGYGYRPGRTLFWYVMTVLSFLGGFWLVTHGVPLFGLTEPAGTQPLHWYEALVLSLASFHGRGFFPQGISLGDPVAILAACEAVIGLFVEISFIATFTQRYFGSK